LEVTFEVNPHNQAEKNMRVSEVHDKDTENALLDYEDAFERTETKKYRCRDCGLLFGTLEEHDRHHRRVHGRSEALSIPSMPL
jgi:hypothetical protein